MVFPKSTPPLTPPQSWGGETEDVGVCGATAPQTPTPPYKRARLLQKSSDFGKAIHPEVNLIVINVYMTYNSMKSYNKLINKIS